MSYPHRASDTSSRGGHLPRNAPQTGGRHSPPQQFLSPDDIYRLEQEGYQPLHQYSETASSRHSSTGSPGQRSYASSYSTGEPPKQSYSTTPTYAYQDGTQCSLSRREDQLDGSVGESRHSSKEKSSRSQSGSPKDSPPGKGKEREKESDTQSRRNESGDSRYTNSRHGGNRRGGGPGSSSGKLISGVFIRY